MVRKTALFAYGIKVIAIWMLIPFVLMFIPRLAGEFGAKVTVQEVTLVKETFSMYPDEHKRYEADVNGRKTNVIAPLTSKEGDTITVILRDGEYYKTANDAEDINANVSFAGRFMKVANNNFGYHVLGLAAAVLHFPSHDQARESHPQDCSEALENNCRHWICSVGLNVGCTALRSDRQFADQPWHSISGLISRNTLYGGLRDRLGCQERDCRACEKRPS